MQRTFEKNEALSATLVGGIQYSNSCSLVRKVKLAKVLIYFTECRVLGK